MKDIPDNINRITPTADVLDEDEVQILIKTYESQQFDRTKSFEENVKESLLAFFGVDHEVLAGKLERISGTQYETFLYGELENELQTRKDLGDFLQEKGF